MADASCILLWQSERLHRILFQSEEYDLTKHMFEITVRILGQLFFYNYIENIEPELVLTVFIFNEMPAIRRGR